MTIRVLIVDDHPVVRSGLRALLSETEGIESVGEAADGIDALAMIRSSKPDVVLMDLGLPKLSGLEATKRVAGSPLPRPAVLVLTMSDDDESLAAAMRAGARGYLLKDADAEEVLAAVRAVARGEIVFGKGVAPAVLDLLRGGSRPRPQPLPMLTSREREILDLVAHGLGNQAVALRLGVAAKTVANTVSGILMKLGAVDRAAAIALARREGLGI